MKSLLGHFAHHTTQHTFSMKQLGIVSALVIIIGVVVVGISRIKRKGSDES